MTDPRAAREEVYCLECGLEEETPEALYDDQGKPLDTCPRCRHQLFTDATAAEWFGTDGLP
jgi:hypothetical protein